MGGIGLGVTIGIGRATGFPAFAGALLVALLVAVLPAVEVRFAAVLRAPAFAVALRVVPARAALDRVFPEPVVRLVAVRLVAVFLVAGFLAPETRAVAVDLVRVPAAARFGRAVLREVLVFLPLDLVELADDRVPAAGLADDSVFAAVVSALAAVFIALVAVAMDRIAVDMVRADAVALVAAEVTLVAADDTFVAADETLVAAVAGVALVRVALDERLLDIRPLDERLLDERLLDARPLDERPLDERLPAERLLDVRLLAERPVEVRPPDMRLVAVLRPVELLAADVRLAGFFAAIFLAPGFRTVAFTVVRLAEDCAAEVLVERALLVVDLVRPVRAELRRAAAVRVAVFVGTDLPPRSDQLRRDLFHDLRLSTHSVFKHLRDARRSWSPETPSTVPYPGRLSSRLRPAGPRA